MEKLQLIIQALTHDINAKQAELFVIQNRVNNLLQIHLNLGNNLNNEINADITPCNNTYVHFLTHRLHEITSDIEKFKEREQQLLIEIKESFSEKEKLKIFLDKEKNKKKSNKED